jgi:hypothetical protein
MGEHDGRLDDGLSPRASFCPLQSRGTLLLVPPVAVTKNGTSQLKIPCQINANSLRYNGLVLAGWEDRPGEECWADNPDLRPPPSSPTSNQVLRSVDV